MADGARRSAIAAFAAVLILSFAGPVLAATEQVRRSTEYPSNLGKYNKLGAVKKLTVGVRATGAGVPANAAQSLTTINGNLNIEPGNVVLDEVLRVDGETFRTLPHDGWLGTHWFGINVDPATLIGVPPNQRTRVEMEVNGSVFAKRFRAAPGNNYSDALLYFGVSTDGLWVELGSKAGVRELWGQPGGYIDAESAARFNGNPKIVLNYYSTDPANITTTGNVGIGVSAPTHKLQLGDPASTDPPLKGAAHSWQFFSSREFKKDIQPLSSPERQQLYHKLGEMDVVRFRYLGDRASDRHRLGVIAEEAPPELLTHDGTTLSLADSIGFVVVAVQELRAEQVALESEISRLEKEISLLEKMGRSK